jgi:hypothetical protein
MDEKYNPDDSPYEVTFGVDGSRAVAEALGLQDRAVTKLSVMVHGITPLVTVQFRATSEQAARITQILEGKH